MKAKVSWLGRVVCAAVVCVLHVSIAQANEFGFGVFRQGGQYDAEWWGEIEGGTQARMQRGGAGWIEIDISDDEFEISTGMFGSLDALNGELAGNYTLEIFRSEAKSVYSFTIATVQAGWFPDAPILDAVPASIPQQYTFSWTGGPPADKKIVEYDISVGGEELFETFLIYESNDPNFADLSHAADFEAYTGLGTFYIEYGNLIADVLTDWTLVDGDDVLSGVANDTYRCVWSGDQAEFNVVPEPATMSLLALGGLALIRRRRTA